MYVKLSQGGFALMTSVMLIHEHGWEVLAKLGYAQYEISNCFAQGECRHNLNTWQMYEWLGCGPSAASQYGGQRYQRPANLDQWLAGMDSKTLPREGG